MAYEMWLNYDNDSKTFCFPVLPESLPVKMSGKDVTFNIDQLGEIFHKSKRNAMRFSFESYFPAEYGSWCQVSRANFRSPGECHEWICQLMEAKNPAHFVLVGGPLSINCYVLISSYNPKENGGDPGTIHYSIELKEYRSASLRTIRNSRADGASSSSVISSEKKDRVSNKEQVTSYTVKSGDCLWNIAKKVYGSGRDYTKILAANRSILDKEAQKYGYSSCQDGNVLYPGTVITIPE